MREEQLRLPKEALAYAPLRGGPMPLPSAETRTEGHSCTKKSLSQAQPL